MDDSEDDIHLGINVVRIITIVVGVIGNLLVIFVILINQEYKKAVTPWYVLQLAIADSIFLLTLPFKISEDFKKGWTFSEGMCKTKETILFLNYYSSILFLTVMSIDRYIAVCKSFTKLNKLRSQTVAYIITAVVWLVSLLLCIPVMMFSVTNGIQPKCSCTYMFPKSDEEFCRKITAEYPQQYSLCLEDRKNTTQLPAQCIAEPAISYYASGDALYDYSTNYDSLPIVSTKKTFANGCSYEKEADGLIAYLLFNFIAMFIIPLLVMTICYTLVVRKLLKSRARSNSLMTSNSSSIQKGKIKRKGSMATAKFEGKVTRVTFICGSLVVLFVICWLPYHAVHLSKIKGLYETAKFCQKISLVSGLLGYINSALNPYVYNFFGTKFRKRLSSAVGTVRVSASRNASQVSGSVREKDKNSSGAATLSTKVNKRIVGVDTGKGTDSSIPDTVFDEEKTESNKPLMTVAYDAKNGELRTAEA